MNLKYLTQGEVTEWQIEGKRERRSPCTEINKCERCCSVSSLHKPNKIKSVWVDISISQSKGSTHILCDAMRRQRTLQQIILGL